MTLTSADVDLIVSLETEVKKLEEQLAGVVYAAPALAPTLEPEIEALKAEIKANEVHSDRASYIAAVAPLKEQLRVKTAANETIKDQNRAALEAAQAGYLGARAQIEASLSTARENLSSFLASVAVP